jgi:hypothetical protein
MSAAMNTARFIEPHLARSGPPPHGLCEERLPLSCGRD